MHAPGNGIRSVCYFKLYSIPGATHCPGASPIPGPVLPLEVTVAGVRRTQVAQAAEGQVELWDKSGVHTKRV